ncbi:hypothetical protein ABTN45_20660, partial [Acinetobacter baumannii]
NNIKTVPPQIGQLKNLKWLSFYCNEIVELPDSLFGLKLERLNVCNNPLSDRQRVISAFSGIDYLKV